MIDLSTFGLVESPQGPPVPPVPSHPSPATDLLRILSQEDGTTCTPAGPVPIRNWSLVMATINECLEKYPGHPVLLNSNGSPDRRATLWIVRRVLN